MPRRLPAEAVWASASAPGDARAAPAAAASGCHPQGKGSWSSAEGEGPRSSADEEESCIPARPDVLLARACAIAAVGASPHRELAADKAARAP